MRIVLFKATKIDTIITILEISETLRKRPGGDWADDKLPIAPRSVPIEKYDSSVGKHFDAIVKDDIVKTNC